MAETKKMAIVVSEKDFERAMMSLMIASTAAASGTEVHIFYTFWGINLLKKNYKPKLKGIMSIATGIMRSKMKKLNIPLFDEILEQCRELDVKLYACSTTMKLMGISQRDLIDGVEVVGATFFSKLAVDADAQLFIG